MKKIFELGKVLIRNLTGFLIFLLVLFLLNISMSFINNDIFSKVVIFLNSNIDLIIIISLMTLITEIFWLISFPLNLPAPLFSAISGLLIYRFILEMFYALNTIIHLGFSYRMIILLELITPLIFIIILLVGSIKIIKSLVFPKNEKKLKVKEKSKRKH